MDAQHLTPPRSTSPHWRRLLAGNATPTVMEESALKALLEDRQARKEDLHSQLRDLKTRRSQLTQELDDVDDSIERINAVFAPIRRIPLDLLGQIFLYVLELIGFSQRAPLFLGHVCRAWRHAALAHPRLWSKIAVVGNYPVDDVTWDQQRAIVEEQLVRSGSSPLSIHIIRTERSESQSGTAPNLEAFSRCLAPVLKHCERWESLTLLLSTPDADKVLSLLEPARRRLLQLENLEYMVKTVAGPELPLDHDLFLECPKLTKLVYLVPSDILRLPWHQLEHCHLRMPVSELQHLRLASAHNLVRLQLEIESDVDGSDIPTGFSVTLPHLRHLQSDSAGVLDALTTPLLQTLNLTRARASKHKFLPGFLRRSRCPLQALLLDPGPGSASSEDFRVDADAMADTLRAAPSLKLLFLHQWTSQDPPMWYPGRVRPKKDLVGDGPMDTLFTAMRLTGTSNDSDLVPDLAMLVYMLRPNPIHTVAFTEMALSRGSTRILLRLSDMRDVSHARALSNVQGIEDNEFRQLARANFPLY